MNQRGPGSTFLVLAYLFVLASVVGVVVAWSWAVRRFAASGDSFVGLLVVGIPIGVVVGLWGSVTRLRRLQAERRNPDRRAS